MPTAARPRMRWRPGYPRSAARWGGIRAGRGCGVGSLDGPSAAGAVFFSLAVGGAALLNQVANYLLTRPRPALWEVLHPELSYGFPSGHAMAAAALATTLGFLLWPTRWRWPAAGLGAAWKLGMGWTRMYLGVHYPSDVLAGWLGSVGWVSGLHLLFARQLRAVGAGVARAAGPVWRWYRKMRGSKRPPNS